MLMLSQIPKVCGIGSNLIGVEGFKVVNNLETVKDSGFGILTNLF